MGGGGHRFPPSVRPVKFSSASPISLGEEDYSVAKTINTPTSKGLGDEESPFLQKERGTNDELEILREIVCNTAAVRTQIMARLREAKARLQKKRDG
jgi:hypothetical protein